MKEFFKLPVSRKVFALALLIRILIMPFFFHPDIKTYHFQASFMRERVFNVYNYLIDHKKDLPLKEEFVYFPLTYLFLGGYQIAVSPLLGGNFLSWVGDASGRALESVGTYRYLFLLKFPYLVIDVLLAFMLMLFFRSKNNKKRVFIYWLFNPFTIILIYFFSNIDVIPVLLVLLGLLLFNKRLLSGSSIVLALATGFKVYPVIFLPLLLIKQKTFKKLLGLLIPFVITMIFIILPFWSNAFRLSAFSSGLSTRLFSSGLSLGFGEMIMPSVILLSLFLYFYFRKREKYKVWEGCLVLLMIVFSMVHYHIQWLLWVMPFFVIAFVRRIHLRPLLFLWLIISFAIPVLYEDLSMSFGLLLPYSPIFKYSILPFVVVQKFVDPYMLMGILHSLLASLSLIIYLRLKKESGV